MEAHMLAAILAALAGFVGAYAMALAAAQGLRRRRVAMAAQGDAPLTSGLLSWRLRNGFAPLMPLAKRLMNRPRIGSFAQSLAGMCSKRGLAATPQALLSCLVVAEVCTGAVTGLLFRSPAGTIACPLCLTCALSFAVRHAEDKLEEEVRDAVPDALESMAACFGSGYTLLQTFKQVAQDIPGALGAVFERSAHMLEMGGSAQRALASLREGSHASQLAFVAVALDVQHQSGGAMRQVLEAAAETVQGELALRRTLQVQTAQARLSARIVVLMPFVLVAAFSLASPDFLSPFFASPVGYALLALAIGMQAAGILLVRRALVVEGVS